MKNNRFASSSIRHGQRGLSLVELLIASALGLLIVAALTQLYADIINTNREMAKTNSQIENARFAMQFLRNDIVHAGYWGVFVPEFDDLMLGDVPSDAPDPRAPPQIPALSPPDPCLPVATWIADQNEVNARLGIAVQAYDAVPGTCAGIINNKLANTDVLVVRHAENCTAGIGNCDAEVAGELIFQASNCTGLNPFGDLELEATPPIYYKLDPNSPQPLHERDCATPAEKRRFIQNIYYVRDYASTVGDGIPTLVRSELGLVGGILAQQPAQALVQGIERFWIELGIDDLSETGQEVDYSRDPGWVDPTEWTVAQYRGDGIPDLQDIDADGVRDEEFVHCSTAVPCPVNQLQNVVAVKLYILARADQETAGYADTKTYALGSGNDAASGAGVVGPFNDNVKRHVFSTTIRINNVAGRRETP